MQRVTRELCAQSTFAPRDSEAAASREQQQCPSSTTACGTRSAHKPRACTSVCVFARGRRRLNFPSRMLEVSTCLPCPLTLLSLLSLASFVSSQIGIYVHTRRFPKQAHKATTTDHSVLRESRDEKTRWQQLSSGDLVGSGTPAFDDAVVVFLLSPQW